MRRPSLTAILVAALACATGRAPATQERAAPPPPLALPELPPGTQGAPRLGLGGDAAGVRRALGEPLRIEKIDSAAAPGARYERWVYAGGREVILLDGKVIDVVP